MVMAYVLLNTAIGSEREVLRQVQRVDGVQEAFLLWGIYDIIVFVRADTMEKLTHIINKLHIHKVHSKSTIVIMENEDTGFAAQTVPC